MTIGDLADLNPRSFTNAPLDDELVSFVPMAAVEEESGLVDLALSRQWRQVSKGYTWPFIKAWWPSATKVSAGVYRVGQRIFVDFWHPSSRGLERGSDELKYYGLAGQLISFLLADGGWRVTVRLRGLKQRRMQLR